MVSAVLSIIFKFIFRHYFEMKFILSHELLPQVWVRTLGLCLEELRLSSMKVLLTGPREVLGDGACPSPWLPMAQKAPASMTS